MDDVMARALAGDDAAFRQLIEPFRAELRIHCYRMLGSLHDAEDVLQETLLAAWQGLASLEARASLRAWLYTIATRRCLNARRSVRRRPVVAFDVPSVRPPEPTRMGEVVWLEPFPGALLEGALLPTGPEARYEQLESISLTFLTALQTLPRRPLAALILCDILEFEASEVAVMLGATVDSVNSALKRARAKMRERRRDARDDRNVHAVLRGDEDVVRQFARAWESADIDAVVALLTDDVFVSMPPFAEEYEGPELARSLFASIFDAGRRFELVPTSVNAQPAFGAYLRSDQGDSRGVGLYVLAVRDGRICALTRFEDHVLEACGLPPSLPRSAS